MAHESISEERLHKIPVHRVKLDKIASNGLILDIGGGGEGIIVKLNGDKVVSIDSSREELMETQNDSLKIVLDVTNLQFIDSSFDVATSFFSLMYFNQTNKGKVFKEIFRVVKPNGRFLIWDVEINELIEKDRDIFVISLEISLPNETINTRKDNKTFFML